MGETCSSSYKELAYPELSTLKPFADVVLAFFGRDSFLDQVSCYSMGMIDIDV